MTDPRLFDQDEPNEPTEPAARRRPAPREPATVGASRRADPAGARPVGASRSADAYPPVGPVAVAPVVSRPTQPVDDELVDLDRYVRIPAPSSPVRRVLITLVGVVLVVGAIVGSGWRWLQNQIVPPGGPGAVVTVEVPSGATTDEIATILEDEGIVAHATVFRYYLRWKGEDGFRAGEYDFRLNSPMDDAIAVLVAGPAPLRFERFTVVEGLTVAEIATSLGEQIDGFDDGDMAAALIRLDTVWRPLGETSWEGLLFPDTYEFAATDEPVAILRRMVDQFDRVARSVGLDPAMNLDPVTLEPVGLTAYDYIIIASLIERETRIPEERAMVSRVIHNRLFIGMTLGIDATVLFARGPERTGPITSADLAIDSPFNTRLNPGLPPTPIAVPGRASLEAALNPAAGDWLYYVLADADGRHFFTPDYDEFLEQKARSEALGLL